MAGLPLLRYWRKLRKTSQLALSDVSGVSARHISFIESGRARPSRWILEVLADALDIPTGDRPELYEQGGFAPRRAQVALSDGALSSTLAQLQPLIERIAPHPCLVLDRRTRILRSNAVAARLLEQLTGAPAPEGLTLAEIILGAATRPRIANLAELAPVLIQRLRRQAAFDREMGAILERVLGDPTIPDGWKQARAQREAPLREVELEIAGHRFAFVVATATLGTSADPTFDQLWLETYLPRDAETRALLDLVAAHSSQRPPAQG